MTFIGRKFKRHPRYGQRSCPTLSEISRLNRKGDFRRTKALREWALHLFSSQVSFIGFVDRVEGPDTITFKF